MNTNVCGFLVTLLIISTSASDLSDPIMQRCLIESGMDSELLPMTHSIKALYDPPTQCYQACTLREFGAIDEKGAINGTYLKAEFAPFSSSDQNELFAAIDVCNNADAPDAEFCLVASDRFQCFLESAVIRRLLDEQESEKESLEV